ncbi:hypothetical protein FHS85_004372 [Rhodoligotrophos appendicifer]|uniref:hypothetical protein n=1 Tax=Rhodoligotrophos appendicifer TaxID=987056 RepID=UPI001184DE8E|nr:hypothetical protein [Rhodoligotrophos appendicifer]
MRVWNLRQGGLAAAFVLGIGATVAGQQVITSALANQPYMQSALGALRSALGNLQAAEPNKGGHRERAIALVEQAIGEVESGIAYAE